MLITPICHKSSIQPVVFVLKKSLLPAIPTLSYMMHKLIKPHGRHSGLDPETSDFKSNVTGYRLSPV